MSDITAAREQLRADARVYGEQLDVNPYTVLLREVQWRAGHVEWLRTQLQALRSVADLSITRDDGTEVDTALVRRYDRERDRLDRIVKVAIDAGIAERYVRLAELHGEVMHQVLQSALNDPLVGLSDEQRVQLVEAMKRALAGAETRRALDVDALEVPR